MNQTKFSSPLDPLSSRSASTPSFPYSGKKHHHAGDRNSMLEIALSRRHEEFEDLTKAYEDALINKKPSDPPRQYGHLVQRAWLHSTTQDDYMERLEDLIDLAEKRLEKLEECLL
ncbi:hypothetical protein BX616_004680 [Lobosporangium transversale]|nr:hypothetical protein BX616_004680 [Lobosporangium transversale]